MIKKTLVAILLIGLAAVALRLADAKPQLMNTFNSTYPHSPLINNCMVCHAGSPPDDDNVNSYGNDFDNNRNNPGAIGSLDSDGDGYSNTIEINAGTLPGDPTSNPGALTSGEALYGTYCAGCHGSLASSTKKGRTVTQIQNAINANAGGMVSLSSLTPAQVAAIATALATTAPVLSSVSVTPPTASIIPTGTQQLTASPLDQNGAPFAGATITWSSGNTPVATVNASTGLVTGVAVGTATITATATSGAITRTATSVITVTSVATPPDGAALYGTNCASCHNPLATSNKKGRTAAQIQVAINNNAGGMGRLSNLTYTQVQAIAAALTSDTTRPTVTAFTIPATSSSLTVTITALTATDNVAVTGYMVTESATAPNASATGWSGTPPASYTCTTGGSITLYAWAKDAAGNVSTSKSASVTITSTNPAPAVDLTIWPGQWLKVTMKYQGYLFGKSNSDVFNDNLEQDGNENVPKMATDHENITGYLKLVSWDPNQGVLQAEIHQKDSQTGQWVSDPLALHLIGGSSTDFLCWTQVNGDFTSGFVVRIQGKEKDGVLKSGTFKTLGGYYFVMNGGTTASAAGSLAGAISMNGSLVPEAKVPVPK